MTSEATAMRTIPGLNPDWGLGSPHCTAHHAHALIFRFGDCWVIAEEKSGCRQLTATY